MKNRIYIKDVKQEINEEEFKESFKMIENIKSYATLKTKELVNVNEEKNEEVYHVKINHLCDKDSSYKLDAEITVPTNRLMTTIKSKCCPKCNQKFVFDRTYYLKWLEIEEINENIVLKIIYRRCVKNEETSNADIFFTDIDYIIVLNEINGYKHIATNKKISNKFISTQSYGIDIVNMSQQTLDKIKNNKLLDRMGISQYIINIIEEKPTIQFDIRNLLIYIQYYYKYKHIEQLIKCKYTSKYITEHVSDIKYLNEGTNIKDILKMPKYIIKKAYETDTIYYTQYLYRLFSYFSEELKINNNGYEDLLYIFTKSNEKNTFLKEIKTLQDIISKFKFKIKINDIKKYIDKVDLYQAIECNSTISIWKDYLNMVGEMELTSYNLYPSSLKLKHDIMLRNYKINIDEIKETKFNKIKENYKQYEIETKNYIMISPNNIKDLIEEGTVLNHCVASYVNRVIDGETNIFFIRKKDNINKRLYTIEIQDNSIIQIKGHSNSSIANEDMEVYDLISMLQNKLDKIELSEK